MKNPYFNYCLISLSITAVMAGPCLAGSLDYYPRNEQITEALDRAETLYSHKTAGTHSQVISAEPDQQEPALSVEATKRIIRQDRQVQDKKTTSLDQTAPVMVPKVPAEPTAKADSAPAALSEPKLENAAVISPSRETRPLETKFWETNSRETKPLETKSRETKPLETNSRETKPLETKSLETKSLETNSRETKPLETKPRITKPRETKPQPDEKTFAYQFFNLSNPQNEMEVGTEAFDYSYREEGLMKLHGMMCGVFMAYQHRFHPNPAASSWADIVPTTGNINLLRFDARLAAGNEIKYRSEGTGTLEGEDHYIFETRFMLAQEIPWKKPDVVVTPYAGVGYRYLLDNNGGRRTTTGNWSYDRESNYYYAPIGLEMTKFYHRGWSTRARLEYDWFIVGRQYSHFEDDPSGIYTQTLQNNQPSGYGARGSLRLAKEGENYEFFIEPFARYWHINPSDLSCTNETCGTEPNNRTQEFGARMGIKF